MTSFIDALSKMCCLLWVHDAVSKTGSPLWVQDAL